MKGRARISSEAERTLAFAHGLGGTAWAKPCFCSHAERVHNRTRDRGGKPIRLAWPRAFPPVLPKDRVALSPKNRVALRLVAFLRAEAADSRCDRSSASAETSRRKGSSAERAASICSMSARQCSSTCVYQKSDSAILVMKTTENRSRCDDSEALNRARERGIFAQRAMNS
jgi:hypothetical protein